MIYLLDTNSCILYLNGLNLTLKARLESHQDSDIAVCSIVLGRDLGLSLDYFLNVWVKNYDIAQYY